MSPEDVQKLKLRKHQIEYALSNHELSGETIPNDNKGLISNICEVATLGFIEQKKKSRPPPYIAPIWT